MKKATRTFKIIAGLLGLLLMWVCVAPYLAARLIVEKKLERADAILVLAGSAAYIERTQKAAAIFREGKSKTIFLTDDGGRAGWSQTEQRNPPYVELAKRELILQGVSEDAIEILPDEISSTYSEAAALSRKMRDGNLHSVILVTSAYHSRRTLWTFGQALIDRSVEIGIEHAQIGLQTPPPFSWWLYAEGWNIVAGEYMKSFAYRTFYSE